MKALCWGQSAFIVFQVFGNPDETCGTSFLKELLKSTSGIKKMEMFRNFSHLVMKNMSLIFKSRNEFIRV